MKYLLASVVIAILILGYLASKNNDKRNELAAAKAQQLSEMNLKKTSVTALQANLPPQDVSATTYVQSLQRAEQSAKDVGKTQDEYMQKMKQAEQ